MIYVTGDKHGDFTSEEDYQKVERFCKRMGTTKMDVMIVLGDHGVRYYPDSHRNTKKSMQRLEDMPITWVLIHGNHDRRANEQNRFKYQYIDDSEKRISGLFYVNDQYPSVLFPDEYGMYYFGNQYAIIVGGAYSIDKLYRLEQQMYGRKQYLWFPNEQLEKWEMTDCSMMFNVMAKGANTSPFVVLSHTCPMSARPTENLLQGIDPSIEDNTMEQWMESLIQDHTIRKNISKWYFGHYHTDKNDGMFRAMYHDIDLLSD